jgi:Ca2+:H+ antiporter
MPPQQNGESAPLLGGNSNGAVTQDTGKWHTEDPRPFIKYPARLARTTWQVLASNYVNVLLVFVPVGIIAGAMGWNPTTVFILNFFAIVPLASLLSFATEELAAKLGETIGGLMNASFGNAVELIVSTLRI